MAQNIDFGWVQQQPGINYKPTLLVMLLIKPNLCIVRIYLTFLHSFFHFCSNRTKFLTDTPQTEVYKAIPDLS